MVLLAWLFIAPVATQWFEGAGAARIFTAEGRVEGRVAVYKQDTNVTLAELLKPTRTLIVLLFLVLLFNSTLLKKVPWVPLNHPEICMSIFSLLLLTNAFLWAGRPAFALHTAFDAFIVSFLAYYISRRLITDEQRFDQLTRVIVYLGGYIIVICLIERLTNPGLFRRIIGPFDSSNTTHVVLIVALYTALLYLNAIRSTRQITSLTRAVAWFVVCLAPVTIALTTVRGNYVGFLVSISLFLFLVRPLTNPMRQFRIIGMGFLMFLVVLLALPLFVPTEFLDQRVGETTNIFGRFATWLGTLQVVAQAPIFGVGLNNIHAFLSRRTTTVAGVANLATPHHSLLAIFAEVGVVGLIAFIAAIGSIVKTGLLLYRRSPNTEIRWRGATVLAIMVGYLTPSFFANTLYSTGLTHIYVYILAGAVAALSHKQPLPSRVRSITVERMGTQDGVHDIRQPEVVNFKPDRPAEWRMLG